MKHSDMDNVPLGRTDLWVTRYCQGTAFRHLGRHADDPMAEAVLRHALDAGVNFFDSALRMDGVDQSSCSGRCLRADGMMWLSVPKSRRL